MGSLGHPEDLDRAGRVVVDAVEGHLVERTTDELRVDGDAGGELELDVVDGARIGILCSMAMAELIGVALFFLAPYAMRLFNDDPAVVAIGVRQSHIEALFFCFLAFAHGVSAVLRGAGRAQVPMYTMLGCWCILRVSYITLALKVWPDIATIFWAYPITWSVSCVVFLIYYLKADWVHALEKSL